MTTPDDHAQCLALMRRAVKEEYDTPLHRSGRPDWQAAVVGYLSLGGSDFEGDDSAVLALLSEAMELEDLNY